MDTFRRRMPLAFGVMLLILLLNAFISYSNTQSVKADAERTNHARNILSELTHLLSDVKDAETGQRGYLLVGDAAYLAPYTDALEKIDTVLTALENLSKDDSGREKNLALLKPAIADKLKELAETVKLRRDQGEPAAVAVVRTDVGKKYMDRIRSIISDMEAAEQKELDRLQQHQERASFFRSFSFTLATMAAVGSFIVGFFMTRRDLRDREQAAYEAERQRQLLSVTLTSVGDAVITTDREGRVTLLNEVAEQLTGWSNAEAAGKPSEVIFNIINEHTRKVVESPAEKVLRHGKIVGLANHTLLVRKDGREVPIDDSGAPIRDRDGVILGVVIVFRDVSEAKAAEKSLRLLESRFRIMADSAPVLIWISDAEKKFTWVNKPWLDYTGRSLEQEVGDGWLDGIYPSDAAAWKKTYETAFQNHQPFGAEFRLRSEDGLYRWMFGQAVPLYGPMGEFQGFIGSCVDITERKALEESREVLLSREREARSEAETANRTKDDFLAVLSHELRTPLTPVLAAVRGLVMDPALPTAIKEDLELIRRNAELEARLIDDLLDLTRISKNKVQLNVEEVDAHLALNHVLQICKTDIDAKKQAVSVEAAATHQQVRADNARLHQMFWNVVKNASKFTPENGKITIRTRNPSPALLEVEVEDNGIGIEPRAIGGVFDAFKQADNTIGKRFGGLGLGLAITRAMARAHGGDVRVQSSGMNTGATFVITLPLSTQTVVSEGGPAPQKLADVREPLHILLVEDHEDTLKTMARVIRVMGHKVTTARNVAEATAVAMADGFDLILSDIGLPDGTGNDFIRAIRPQKSTPAIALTGFGMEEDVRRSIDAGFNAHLTKPVNFERLQSVIDDLLPPVA